MGRQIGIGVLVAAIIHVLIFVVNDYLMAAKFFLAQDEGRIVLLRTAYGVANWIGLVTQALSSA